jgi:hypothetical protein
MEAEYSSCLVVAKDGEGEALKSLLVQSEDIKSVNEISPRLFSVAFQRQLDSQGIEEVLSPFGDKIERWQPNYRVHPLIG